MRNPDIGRLVRPWLIASAWFLIIAGLLASCLPDDDGGDAAPLPPAEQLCELPEGVDGYWQVPCGQCGHRCLDGCTQEGRCRREQVYASDYALNGPLRAGEFLIVGDPLGTGNGEDIVRIDASGEAQTLATTSGQAFGKHVHDGWVYWVDDPLSGEEVLQRTRVDGTGSVEDLLSGQYLSLLEVTERGLYVQQSEVVSRYSHDASSAAQLFSEPDWFSITQLDVFEHADELFAIIGARGLHTVPIEGGTPELLAEREGFVMYGDTTEDGVLYAAARGDEELGTERQRELVAVDLETGELDTLVHWEQTSFATAFSAPIIRDEHLWWSTGKTVHYFPMQPDEPMRLEAEDVDSLFYRHAIHTELDMPTLAGMTFAHGYLYFSSFTNSRRRDPLTVLYRVRVPR